MADLDDKKVVNIGWLKEQGYVIKEAYTDNTWCPTYNNITAGTIGDNIGVNTTCYGTGLEYAVTQLVCVKDVYPSGECSCPNVYGTATVTQTTGGLTTIPATGGTFYFSSSLVPYSAYTSTPIAGGCSPCTYSSSAYTSFTTSAIAIPANTSTSIKPIEGTDNHIHYVINQAAHVECSCDVQYGTATVTQTDSGLSVIPASGGSYTFSSDEVPYSAFTSTPTAEGCSPCVYSSSAYTSFVTDTIVIPANETSEVIPIENTNNHIHYVINQEAKACDCDALVLETNEVTWDYNSTEAKLVTFTITSCVNTASFRVYSPTTYFNGYITAVGTIYFKPNGTNPTDVEREAVYDLSYTVYIDQEHGMEKPCHQQIRLIQYTSGCTPTTCTCYKVGSATASTVAATATSATVTWPYSAITATRDANCQWTSGTPTTGTASQTVNFDANTSCSDVTRSGSFSWGNHSACTNRGCSSSDVTVSWSLTQGGVVASCSSLAVTAGGPGAAEGGNGLTLGSYTGNCFTNVQVSKNVDWITSIGLSNKTITGNVSPNSSANSRDAVIKVTANECSTGKTFTYTQNANTSTCPDSFTGETISLVASTLPAEAASPKLLGYATLTDEYTGYTFSSSNTSMINNIATGTSIAPNVYAITGTVYENTSSYGRYSTITVNAKGPNLPSTGCNDTFTLGQEAATPQGTCPSSGDIIYSTMTPAAGGSPSTAIMMVKKDSVYTGYSFTSSDTSIINPSNTLTPATGDRYLVMAYVAENTGDLSRTVNITVNVTGTTTPSTGCSYTEVPVTQLGSCATVDSLYYVGPINNYKLAGNAQTGAGVAYVAYFSPYASWSVQFTGGPYSFVRNATVTNEPGGPGGTKKVTVDIDENNTGADRTFTLMLTGAKTDGYNCTKTITITQEEATSSCVDLDITSSSVSFNSSGGSINVGTISGSHTLTKTSDSPNWVTVNTSNGNISLSVSATTVSRNGTVTFKVDDDTCDGQTITVSQTVPVSVITYYSPSKANVNLSNFTPAATAETFSNGVGKVEFNANPTAIGDKAFSGKSAMTGIDIPNSVTSIGNSAFTNCYSLTSVTIPSSVTSIGNAAFYNCSSLRSVTIPNSVTSIRDAIFYSCYSLTSVTIPNSVTSIGGAAFQNCSGLTSVTIPNSVTSIGGDAFSNCSSLTSVTIPSGVTTINNNLLYNCTSLSSVTLESETLQLKPYSISNCPNLRKIEMTSVTACPSDYQYALENSADCPIYVPEQYLDKFWNGSFSYADRVISHVGNNSIVYKANSKLDGPNLDRAYSVTSETSSSKLSILLHTFNSSTKIGKITYDGTVRSFHDNTFNTQGEIYIILPEGLQVIGQEVFVSNYNLKSIFIPNSVVRLGKYTEEGGCETFHNCTSLKRFVAGSGLTSIGTQCFTVSSPAYTSFTFYSTSAPALYHKNTFADTGSCPIYVPCGRVNSYKASNIWNDSTISNRIKAIPPCTS